MENEWIIKGPILVLPEHALCWILGVCRPKTFHQFTWKTFYYFSCGSLRWRKPR
jgi:hypothetical protein